MVGGGEGAAKEPGLSPGGIGSHAGHLSREYFYFRKMAVTTVKRWVSGDQGRRQETVAEVQGTDQGGGEPGAEGWVPRR